VTAEPVEPTVRSLVKS
jgi:hypothetical protein